MIIRIVALALSPFAGVAGAQGFPARPVNEAAGIKAE